MAEYKTVVAWARDGAVFTDNRYSRVHRWIFTGGIEVPGSASPDLVPPPLSSREAVAPEEALLISLSSSHMLWFLSYASRRGFVVESYRDEAVGMLGENARGLMAMKKVTLRPEVRFGGGKLPTREDVVALHDDAHDQCFIAHSVTTDVRCEPVWDAGTPAPSVPGPETA
jgi:organic hydroperoxide reductase OsmC/OhrA